MRFRYAWDKSGRIFTEQQWLEQAYPHFIWAAHDTLSTYLLFLTHTFNDHLNAGTIVLAEDCEADENPPRALAKIGCPYCHHIHTLDKHGWVYPFVDHRQSYSPYGGWK